MPALPRLVLSAGIAALPVVHPLTTYLDHWAWLFAASHAVDRMPVLLPREAWDDWLDPGLDDAEYLQSLLAPPPDDVLGMYPISTRVNNVRNQGPELIEPIEEPEPQKLGLED